MLQFNEKVYLFIWWWLLLVGIATLFSLVYWLTTPRQSVPFVRQYLRVHYKIQEDDPEGYSLE